MTKKQDSTNAAHRETATKGHILFIRCARKLRVHFHLRTKNKDKKSDQKLAAIQINLSFSSTHQIIFTKWEKTENVSK